MNVRSLAAATEKYLRNCIRAYFEGQNLHWILGVIGAANTQVRLIVETRFGQHAGTAKYQELMARL